MENLKTIKSKKLRGLDWRLSGLSSIAGHLPQWLLVEKGNLTLCEEPELPLAIPLVRVICLSVIIRGTSVWLRGEISLLRCLLLSGLYVGNNSSGWHSSVGLEDVRHPTAVFSLQTQDHREASSSYHLLVFTDDCPFALSRIYNCVYEAGIGENWVCTFFVLKF